MDVVNTEEMINVIKDAGMYEDHMSKEQMELYYKAIVDSKDASTAEQDSHIINDSPEDMFASEVDPPSPNKTSVETSVETQLEDSDFEPSAFKPKVRSYSRKNSDKEHINKNISAGTQEDESIPQDATKACFSFDDMPKDNDSPLVIIYHPPSYINIQNSAKFISADVSTRAMMLFKYHSEMEKLRSALSRQSFFPAPQPKPIEITISAYAFETVNETEETYVSRAGRQTKRKVYNDDEDFDTSTSNKKAKSKSVERPKWQSKTKPPKKTEPAQESMETETTEVVQKETPKQSIRSKKLSNTEIMSRSKLFEDSPIKRSSRSEKLFDKLKEESIKKQKDERKLEAFEKTLNSDNEPSQNESQKEENMIQVSDEEYPKRVIPPIPTRRKPINSRAQQQKSNSKKPEIVPSVSNDVGCNSSQEKENDLFESVGPSTSRTVTSTNVECPICLKMFSEDSIAEHASNCGEEQVVTRNTSRHKITCQKCDKVITSNYELHISMCKKRQEELDNEIE